jgi:O-antigen/teichoic acid export membrane protein
MHPLKRLVGQTAIYGLSSIIGRFLNYLLVPLYTTLFTTDVYGVVTELYAYVVFLIIILTYGMETAFFRFAESEKDSRKVYSTSVIPLFTTSLLFIILVLFFVEPIADLLDYTSNKEYIVWFAFIIGIDAFTAVPFARLRQQNKAVRFATVKLINIGINIGLNLFFLLLCPFLLEKYPDSVVNLFYSADIGVGYVFISNLIASIATLILLFSDIFKINFSVDFKLLKKLLAYSLPLMFAGLAGMVNETLDRILLKHLVVPPETIADAHKYIMSQLGIYGANFKLAVLMTLFIQTFRYAAEPFFFSQAKEKNSKELYANVMKYFVIFGLLIFLGMTMYIDIVKFFIDSRYHSGVIIVPVLLMANLFLGLMFNLSIWYKLTNLTRFGMLISVFGAAITVSLNYLLIPQIGYLGCAWASFFSHLSMLLLSFYLGRKYFPINYEVKTILIYIGFAVLLFLTSRFLNFKSELLHYLINTLLIIIFIFFVLFKEGIYKKILIINQKFQK